MARASEEVVFCSFRMYLDNPQHLKVAKALKKIEEDRQRNIGLTKNQFIIDAIEYYIDHYYLADDCKILVTRKELLDMKQEIKEEMQAMLRMEWMRPYNPFATPTSFPVQPVYPHTRGEEPDDTIADLVSDWD